MQGEAGIGFDVLGAWSDVRQWTTHPRETFAKLRRHVESAIAKFHRRRDLLPILYKRVTAIGVYSAALPADNPRRQQLADVYAAELERLEELRNSAEGINSKTFEAIEKLREIAQRLGFAKQETGTGSPTVIAISVVAIAAATMATAWSFKFENADKNVSQALKIAREACKGLPPDECAAITNQILERGINPNDTGGLVGKVLGISPKMVMGIILVTILAPTIIKQAPKWFAAGRKGRRRAA